MVSKRQSVIIEAQERGESTFFLYILIHFKIFLSYILITQIPLKIFYPLLKRGQLCRYTIAINS